MMKRRAFLLGLFVVTAFISYFFLKDQLFSTNVHAVSFEEIKFEKSDSSLSSSLLLIDSTEKDKTFIEDSIITIDNPLSTHYKSHLLKSHQKYKNKTVYVERVDSSLAPKPSKSISKQTKKGRALSHTELPPHNFANKRLQFSAFFRAFSPGDYIEGKELATYYLNDKNLNYLTRKTISSYVAKNIEKLTRVNNSFIIETIASNDINIKLNIPFIEKMQVMIKDSAMITFGNTIQSKEPLFNNALLLPVQTHDITVISNGNTIPKNGFVSGDFYFTEYAATKGGFSLK